MEKYTNLEQAINDPSLAIITGEITTLKELNDSPTIIQMSS